ncbi:hypothetical protein [Glutamicibacter arilaitensis]|uniref:hypothetical protein n=1 Tax=Glutamicibacter arilaitensis TaxID=256701 RepID=UPI003F9E4C29
MTDDGGQFPLQLLPGDLKAALLVGQGIVEVLGDVTGEIIGNSHLIENVDHALFNKPDG